MTISASLHAVQPMRIGGSLLLSTAARFAEVGAVEFAAALAMRGAGAARAAARFRAALTHALYKNAPTASPPSSTE